MIILQLLGALGVFLFGMKYMSEGLQRVAGARLKGLLGRITSNRFTAALSGMGLTVVVQSSTASTVMIVSFVTAGLMSLTQAIGMIMGANIGTTTTAWVVSLLGFKVNVGAFALPAVGVGLALTFLRGSRERDWGEVLIGFGLLFLGLVLMRDTIPAVSDPKELEWMLRFTGHGMWSVLLFVLAGGVLTVILQSSSATATLTLTFAAMGWIPYELAVAMILGENVGTTFTANIAAISGNTDSKRAARVHFLFNIVGVAWSLLLFHSLLLPVVDALVPGNPDVDFTAIQDEPVALAAAAGVITTHLAALHTTFNVVNTALMLPFAGVLEKIVRRMVPDREGQRRLHYLHMGLIEAPELMVVQAGREMQHMTEEVRAMFAAAMQILLNPQDKLGRLIDQTLEREKLVDELENDISKLLVSATRGGMGEGTAARMAEMAQNTHRLERIGDHCSALVNIARRIRDEGTVFDPQDRDELSRIGSLVDQALEQLGKYLAGDANVAASEALEQRIDETRRSMRSSRIQRLQEGRNDVTVDLAFLDTISHLEEIGDRATGIIRRSEETLGRSRRVAEELPVIPKLAL